METHKGRKKATTMQTTYRSLAQKYDDERNADVCYIAKHRLLQHERHARERVDVSSRSYDKRNHGGDD